MSANPTVKRNKTRFTNKNSDHVGTSEPSPVRDQKRALSRDDKVKQLTFHRKSKSISIDNVTDNSKPRVPFTPANRNQGHFANKKSVDMVTGTTSMRNIHLKVGAIVYTDADKAPPYYSKPGPAQYQPNQTHFSDDYLAALSKHNKS